MWGAPPIAGAGLLVGLGLSLVFGAVNLRLLALWRNRARRDPGSAFLRSQMRLFADKVCSNLLLVVALLLMLGLDGEPGCRFIDPAASLVTIVVSACWAWSMACRVLRDGGTALRPPARTGI